MITKKQYGEYLMSTPKNCTCPYLAEHLEDVSHAVVNDLLREERVRPREGWRLVKDRRVDSTAAFLLVDDSVPDKRQSRFIELVRAQDRGTAHRGVRGMGGGSVVPRGGKDSECQPRASRGQAPEVEGKTKNDPLPELVVHATEQQPSQARPSVFAAWDAAAEKLQLLHRRTGTFCTPLKSKRVVRLSTEQGSSPWEELVGRPDRLAPGVSIKLKEGPCKGRLFTRVAPDGDSAWVSTTDRAETVTAQGAEASSDVRGQVEEWHRGLKHLTGSEQCPCRGARAQRHHLACCSQAGVSLKVKAKELGQTR